MAVTTMLIGECHQNREVEQEEKQEQEYSSLLGSETSLCKNPLQSCRVKLVFLLPTCFCCSSPLHTLESSVVPVGSVAVAQLNGL